MAKLTMKFIGEDSPELHETAFRHPLLQMERRSVRGKAAGAYQGYNTFQWTKGVQAISVLLLRAKIEGYDEPVIHGFSEPHLMGDVSSLAASLDYAMDKQTTWLLDMFGWDKNGYSIARRAIYRANSGRKRKGPVALSLNKSFLNPNEIEVSLDGKDLTNSKKLLELCRKIELRVSNLLQEKYLRPLNGDGAIGNFAGPLENAQIFDGSAFS